MCLCVRRDHTEGCGKAACATVYLDMSPSLTLCALLFPFLCFCYTLAISLKMNYNYRYCLCVCVLIDFVYKMK